MNSQEFYATLLQTFQTEGNRMLLTKKQLIIKEGEVEHHLYYIESGAVRLSYLTEFEDQTIRLGYTGNIINSLASYFSGKPSEFYIETLRKSTIIALTKEQIVNVVNESQDTLKAYISLLEQQFVEQIDREIDLLTASPALRLKRMLLRSPDVFQEVPLKYIASCLRMTPETLSRLRNS